MEESQQEAHPTFAAPPDKKKTNKRFLYLVVAIVVIVVLFFGYKIFGGKSSTSINEKPAVVTPEKLPTDTPEPTVSTSPTPKLTDTPTPKPTVNPLDKASGLDRSNLSVMVENGSGEAGVAGKGSDILKNLGYDVTGTDNADNFDYSNVVIEVKAASSDFLSLLEKDLGASYTIGSTSATLDDGFSSDALVIIGK